MPVRLTEAEVERLDALRGGTSRSAYLRALLTNDTQPVPSPEEVLSQNSATYRGRSMEDVALPIAPEQKRHLHRRGERLDPPRWVKGQAIYSYRCADPDCAEVME